MLAQMIDKIVSLKETKTFEIGGQTYTDGHLTRIPPHVDRPEAISVSGLDGVCKLIRACTPRRASAFSRPTAGSGSSRPRRTSPTTSTPTSPT